MLRPALPIRTEKVESETVYFRVDLIDKLMADGGPLRGIDFTLKDGKLNPLTVIFTYLGNPAQPALTLAFHGGDIITDYNQHFLPTSR